MARFRAALSVFLLMAGDVLAVGVSYIIAYFIRNLIFNSGHSYGPGIIPLSMLVEKAYLLAIYPFVFAYEGLYTKRLSGWEETRRYLRGILISTAAVTILLFMVRFWIVSRVVVLLAMVVAVLLVPVMRAALKWLLVVARLRSQPLVLVGTDQAAALFRRELADHRSLGYRVIGLVSRAEADEPVERLLERSAGYQGATVVVLSDAFRPDELQVLFRHAERRFAQLLVIPNAALLQSSDAEVEQVGSVLVMKYRYNLLRPFNTMIKRCFELAASAVLVLVLAPLLGVLGLLVRMSSPGPVLFRQQRIGRGRAMFGCFKFRTMYADAEARLLVLLRDNPQVREEWERYARITNDPRVTRIGRFLRRYSLDELPQLFNVLRGEMALVGPRPYLPSEQAKVGDYLDTIVRVRPGLSGLWQVSGRAALPFAERMLLDEYYIRNWSLWIDFSILVRTLKAVFGGRGAY
jgi:undecaprenyl-phosphate galactose phosphotransferase